jgi:hypothetical protein
MAGRYPFYLYGYPYEMEEDEEDYEHRLEQMMRFFENRFLQPARAAPSCTSPEPQPMDTG